MRYHIVKVTSNKSRHVINIPVCLARETGIDKTDFVIISKSADNKLEIKRYDKEGDIREYIQDIIDDLKIKEYHGKTKEKRDLQENKT